MKDKVYRRLPTAMTPSCLMEYSGMRILRLVYVFIVLFYFNLFAIIIIFCQYASIDKNVKLPMGLICLVQEVVKNKTRT